MLGQPPFFQGLYGQAASVATAFALVCAPAAPAVGAAPEPPRIDHLEFFLHDQVTIHFDTDANRTYELQFRNLTPALTPWTNLFVAPRIPFPNHYIVVDTRTNRARIYRLKVTP